MDTLEGTHKYKKLLRNRLIIAFIFCCILFTFLIGRMFQLQWLNFEQFHGMAENNRISQIILPPERGLIFDRNQILLADNQPVYALTLVRKEIKDIEALKHHLIRLFSGRIHEEKFEKYFQWFKKGYAQKQYTFPYSLTEKEAAQFAVNSHLFSGVHLTSRLKRIYPHGSSAVHALGYVSRINQKESQRINKSLYEGTQVIGKAGVERFYETELLGQPGYQQVETNVKGHILRTLYTQPPQRGKDINTTLDIELQKYAETLLAGKRGSVVALDPRNGEILALVSTPTYDPNLFVEGIDQKNYQRLLYDPNRPFINRAINGQYPPGSTIKQFIALGALEQNVISYYKRIFDPGYFEYENRRYRDWKRSGHGWVDMKSSIAQSCDTYFYKLSLDMGIDGIEKALEPFGFGQKTGIDIMGESKGILPSRTWKKATKGKPWYHGETIISSIGQGYNLATPLQLARATAILANRGTSITPHLVRTEEKSEQITIKNSQNWEKIIDAMEEVMHGAKGTARRHGQGLNYRIAGKTGTAQVFSLNEADYNADELEKRLHDHSLFVGFAPSDKPLIAIAVIAENSGSGSKTAAPIGVNVMKKYLANVLSQSETFVNTKEAQ